MQLNHMQKAPKEFYATEIYTETLSVEKQPNEENFGTKKSNCLQELNKPDKRLMGIFPDKQI